jgi:hypothetical protein
MYNLITRESLRQIGQVGASIAVTLATAVAAEPLLLGVVVGAVVVGVAITLGHLITVSAQA